MSAPARFPHDPSDASFDAPVDGDTAINTQTGVQWVRRHGTWGAITVSGIVSQQSRVGQLTDSSGGTSGGATVPLVNPASVDTTAAALVDTANAIATLAARVNALELTLHAAGVTA